MSTAAAGILVCRGADVVLLIVAVATAVPPLYWGPFMENFRPVPNQYESGYRFWSRPENRQLMTSLIELAGALLLLVFSRWIGRLLAWGLSDAR